MDVPIKETRALLAAALDGSLNDAPMTKDPIFGFEVPAQVPGVDDNILNPRNSWDDAGAYDAQARKLSQMFIDNFKIYEGHVSEAVRSAAPSAF